MRRAILTLCAIIPLGLLVANCQTTARSSGHHSGYSYQAAPAAMAYHTQPAGGPYAGDPAEMGEGDEPEVMLAGGPDRRRHGRGAPRCPGGMKFSTQYGKCIGSTLHDIPLSERGREALDSDNCARLETRHIRRGNRLVEQQRCAERRS